MASRFKKRHTQEDTIQLWSSKWMGELGVKSFDESARDIIDAFEDLKATFDSCVIKVYDEDTGVFTYSTDYHAMAAMCTDIDVIYSECGAIMFNRRKHFDKDPVPKGMFNQQLFDYMKELRNICSHHYGPSSSPELYLMAIEYDILPHKDNIKHMLCEALNKHPESKMDDTIRSFDRRKRRMSSRRFRLSRLRTIE